MRFNVDLVVDHRIKSGFSQLIILFAGHCIRKSNISKINLVQSIGILLLTYL